jgi:hypothetical protein
MLCDYREYTCYRYCISNPAKLNTPVATYSRLQSASIPGMIRHQKAIAVCTFLDFAPYLMLAAPGANELGSCA